MTAGAQAQGAEVRAGSDILRADAGAGHTCADCLFSAPDLIPDPKAEWKPGNQKPRVEGYRCHAARPTYNGFPAVPKGVFCAYFTERGTMAQPYRRLVEAGYAAAEGGAQ